MRPSHLIFLVSFVCSIRLQAQDQIKKWDISVGYGFSLPVGDFKKVTPEKSIAYFNNREDTNGFDKDGNSAAQNGTAAFVKISYQLQRAWALKLKVGYTRNPVNTQPATDYVNDWISNFPPNRTLAFIQDDYQVLTVSFGADYNFYVKKFTFSIYPNVGLGMLSSPEYVMTLQAQNLPTTAVYTYSIDENKINSPALGIDGSISYNLDSHFYMGVNVAYSHANFDYEWTMRSPGYDPYSRTDVVTYRNVLITAQVGFRF